MTNKKNKSRKLKVKKKLVKPIMDFFIILGMGIAVLLLMVVDYFQDYIYEKTSKKNPTGQN